MKQLLEYIIPNIVNHPEDVKIEETELEGLINVTIQTHPEDIGRVIGKSGKVIKSIRQIARIIAIKQGVRVNIDVVDAANKNSQTDSSEDTGAEIDSNSNDSLELDATTDQPTNQSLAEEEGIDLQTD